MRTLQKSITLHKETLKESLETNFTKKKKSIKEFQKTLGMNCDKIGF